MLHLLHDSARSSNGCVHRTLAANNNVAATLASAAAANVKFATAAYVDIAAAISTQRKPVERQRLHPFEFVNRLFGIGE